MKIEQEFKVTGKVLSGFISKEGDSYVYISSSPITFPPRLSQNRLEEVMEEFRQVHEKVSQLNGVLSVTMVKGALVTDTYGETTHL